MELTISVIYVFLSVMMKWFRSVADLSGRPAAQQNLRLINLLRRGSRGAVRNPLWGTVTRRPPKSSIEIAIVRGA
jgi:hypothetical protein